MFIEWLQETLQYKDVLRFHLQIYLHIMKPCTDYLHG